MSAPFSRRRLLLAAASGCAMANRLPRSGVVADEPISPAQLYLPDEIDRAVNHGLDFLASAARADGSITDNNHPVTMSSLAIMAMASTGVTPADPSPRGKVVDAALRFVLDPRNQEPNGYYGRKDSSRMYGHGITTLMLTEMLGMGRSIAQNAAIHDSLSRAIALILASQSVTKPSRHQGGWRYQPNSKDSDLSISVWQLMALRSAKNDAMAVPAESIESAIGYLTNSFTPRPGNAADDLTSGGFTYTPGSGYPTFTMTAAGLLAMQVCGQYQSPTVAASAAYLMNNPPKRSERFFFYGMYYYAQGMHQFGGRHAAVAAEKTSELLLPLQGRSGAFTNRDGQERNVGRVYCTAMAILALTVRYHYLPIYQR